MSVLEVLSIPVLSDNYVHLVHDPENGTCAVIDPAVAAPVLAAADARGWRLTHILCTHHHSDHVGGNRDVKAATGCTVVGAAVDADRIPGIDVEVAEGDVFRFGQHAARIFEVPGHTSGHIAYWFGDSKMLFCGDTLFSLGCGRLFEGTPIQMWASLLKLRALPDDTLVYCAHEYTNSNADFALTQEPDNSALKTRAAQVVELREAGKPTVPSLLGEEKAVNPFLRADVPEFQAAAGLSGMGAETVFAEVRGRKDRF